MKIKRIILCLLIVLFCMLCSSFLACDKNDESHKKPIDEQPTKEEYPDEVNKINLVTISASTGEGYIVKHPSQIEKDKLFTFEVVVFENYSKSNMIVSINGSTLEGNNDGIYQAKVSTNNADILVSNVNRESCAVNYNQCKGVSFLGDKKLRIGETLEFSVAFDNYAIIGPNFKVLVNGIEVTKENDKYTVNDVKTDLQIKVLDVTYPSYIVSYTNGEGFEIKTNLTEIFRGDDLLVNVVLDNDYILRSNPVVYGNGVALEKDENGIFVLNNVSENINLSVDGIEKTRKCKVSFKNINENYQDVMIDFGKVVENIDDPKMDGRTFKGWNVNGEIFSLENYTITDDVVLEAVWNYNYKDTESVQTTIYSFTKEDTEAIAENIPQDMKIGYGKNKYQQNADWESFRVIDNKEGTSFSVTFPKFDFSKYGYIEFKFSTIWSNKKISYNNQILGSVTNGANLNNYLEIFITNGYVGCGDTKIALLEGVYDGVNPLTLEIDTGKGRHGIFSDFYTYEYDYISVLNEINNTDESTNKEVANRLVAKYNIVKDFLTEYEKISYSVINSKIKRLKNIAMPLDVWTDGSFATIEVAEWPNNIEGHVPSAVSDTPLSGAATSFGLSKRWNISGIKVLNLILDTIALDVDEKAEYKISLQSGDFPFALSINGESVLTANSNLDVITITVFGNGTINVKCEQQASNMTISTSQDVVLGETPLIVTIDKSNNGQFNDDKSDNWGNLFVNLKVVYAIDD